MTTKRSDWIASLEASYSLHGSDYGSFAVIGATLEEFNHETNRNLSLLVTPTSRYVPRAQGSHHLDAVHDGLPT